MIDRFLVSPFLRLPVELRYSIYDHLCTLEPRSYPIRTPSPITSASLAFSPLPLLLTNRHLLSEVSTYYFTRCTFRFVAQSFRIATSSSAAIQHIVQNMRRVELLLLPGTMKATPSDPWPSIMVKGMSPKWLDEQVNLLRDEAAALRTVIVSIRRVSWDHAWSMREEMEALLKPLDELKGRVEFEVGEVSGPASIEEGMGIELAGLLKRLNS